MVQGFQRHAISRFTLTRRLREILALLAEAGTDSLPRAPDPEPIQRALRFRLEPGHPP